MSLSELADARMTASRAERKYLVDARATAGLVGTLERELQRHHYTGADANPLPRAQHFATTIYFDTDDGAVLREAESGAPHTKLRAREYYDLHPDLTELAQSPDDLVRYSPVLWLELKARDGDHSDKHRIGIPKSDVPRFFASGEPSAEMLALTRDAHGASADAAVEALRSYRARFAAPLGACALVNYRRAAWQSADGQLRVTLDRALTVFAPPPNLWTAQRALTRERLGTPAFVEPRCILEVKHRGPVPAWVAQALAMADAEHTSLGKFVLACRRLRPPSA